MMWFFDAYTTSKTPTHPHSLSLTLPTLCKRVVSGSKRAVRSWPSGRQRRQVVS